MPMDCYKCKKESGGPKDIEFSHKGFKFSVYKSGMRCPECEAEEYRELFDRLVEEEDFIRGTPENLEVNWERYCNIRRSDNTKDRMADLLRALGIFSLKSEGNWYIVADMGINLNPPVPFARVFFVRLKDAVDYACMEYANTLYGWEIRHIDEVMPKNVALDKAL